MDAMSSVFLFFLFLSSPVSSFLTLVRFREGCVLRCQKDEPIVDPLDSITPGNKWENSPTRNVHEKEESEAVDRMQYVVTTSFEAERLKTLPSEYLKATKSLIQQLLPRVAFGILVLHVMLLIPTLYYLKVILKFPTIIPFLYIAPVVFLIPYVVCFLWEYKIIKVPYLDNRIRQMIDTQTKEAKDLLVTREEELTLRINLEREGREIEKKQAESDKGHNELYILTRELAFLRLLSKIDADALATEVLNLKRFLFKQSGVSGSSSNDSSSGSIDSAEALLGQLSLREEQSKSDKMSIATSTFVDMAVSNVGGNKEDALEALKKFQTELDSMITESAPLTLIDERKETISKSSI